jgi:radical SAM protein with 4Fe4S-binding SPASM domain
MSQTLLNEHFVHTLGKEGVLLTTRHGGWCLLSEEEYGSFKSNQIAQDSPLFQKVEDAGIVLNKKTAKKIVSDLRKENSFLYRPANYHVISVTEKCNFNCIYCHPDAGPGKKEMDENMARKVLDFIFDIPMQICHIVIQGGEPLLKWDLIKFIYKEAGKRAKEKGIKKLNFSITTNLSLMTEKIAEELKGMDIVLSASFDGPEELHNRHRPFVDGRGSYKTVVDWFQRLKNEYKIRISFLPLITRISLEYGPKAIIDEFLKFGDSLVFFKEFRPTGRALTNLKELEMKPEEFFNFWREGIEYCISLNKKGIKMKERSATYLITNILTNNRPSMCVRRPCGAGGFPMLSYSYDGIIHACDSLRSVDFFALGNVEEDDYQAVRKKALPLLALAPDLIPVCSACPFAAYCGLCLGEASGVENDMYPKIPRSFSCRWQKMALEYLFSKLSKNDKDAIILKSWAVDPYCQQKPLCQV